MNSTDHLKRGRHERFTFGPLTTDELARWCVEATYDKVRRQRNPFRRKPRHLDKNHEGYHK